jgi:hypothetical protein
LGFRCQDDSRPFTPIRLAATSLRHPVGNRRNQNQFHARGVGLERFPRDWKAEALWFIGLSSRFTRPNDPLCRDLL